MPTYTVDMGQGTNNAWAEGASALAKALTPDYKSKADAALMGVQADQSRASANASNASAAKYYADRDKTLAETTGINWEQGIRENLFSQWLNWPQKPVSPLTQPPPWAIWAASTMFWQQTPPEQPRQT